MVVMVMLVQYLDQRPHPRMDATLKVVIAGVQALDFKVSPGCDIRGARLEAFRSGV